MDFIDSKYIGLISPRLQNFKKVKHNLYNFRCCFCGDSKRNKKKARGYFYQIKNNTNFKCHNCGLSISLNNFLKDLDSSLYKQYVMEKFKDGHSGKNFVAEFPKFEFTKPVFRKKIDLPEIQELDSEHPAKKYLQGRKIPEKFLKQLYYCENFKQWTNEQKHTFESTEKDEPRIIIPLINHGELVGFQGRSLNKKSKVKYITIILDESHPKIYGLDTIDWDKTVYITEGPFDSMFIDNAIAMAGSDIDKMFLLSNFDVDFVMVYDNEKRNKQIVERMEKAINLKLPIVIWPDTIVEKDINELILGGITENEIMKIIKNNTYSGLEAKAKLIGWKRV